jgi:hypothetical protein
MEIDASPPVEGKDFHFTTVGGVGATNIVVTINGKVVHQSECPDPPCHEEMRVPAGSGGGELRVIARDSEGSTIERKFFIGRTQGQAGGGAMTA